MYSSDEHDYSFGGSASQLDDHEVIIERSSGKEQRKRSSLANDHSKEVYEHWSIMSRGKTPYDSQWKCDYCEYNIKHKKLRMVSHLEMTHGYNRLKDTFDPMKTKIPAGRRSIETDDIQVIDIVDEDENPEMRSYKRIKILKNDSKPSSMAEPSIFKFVQHLNEKQMSEAISHLSNFLYEKALPFTVFENESWEKFISIVAPAFKTPTEYQLRTSLLEASFQTSMTESLVRIKESPAVTIGIDECKLAGKPHMINLLACTPEPYFLTSYDSKGASITTDLLENLFKKTLTAHQIEIKAIVSDNGSSIKSLRYRLESRSGLQLQACDGSTRSIRAANIYCLCHGVSLIIQDFSKDKWIKSKVDLAMEIARKFNHNHQMKEILTKFTEIDGLAVIQFNIPPKVRWLYLQKFLKSFTRFEGPIKSMFKCKMDSVKRILGKEWRLDLDPLVSDEYWRDLNCICSAVTPLCHAITAAESITSTISDGFMWMAKLRENKHKFVQFMQGREMDSDSWSKKFDKRYNDVVSDNHKLAAFLDPRFRFDSRTQLSFLEAQKYLISAADIFGFSECITNTMTFDLFDYIEERTPFTQDAFSSYLDDWGPSGWWRRCAPHKELTKLAIILMNIPSSNASVERSFSHQGLIFAKRRQKMTAETLNKLTKIKFDSSRKKTKKESSTPRMNDSIWDDLNSEEIIEECPPLDIYDVSDLAEPESFSENE